jgi:AcrR family transcriptional regulator
VTTTRDRILDAAAALMRERGLAGTTTRQIAAASGYSEAAIYKHFADKVDLMAAVLHERSTAFTQLAEALAERAGPLEDRLTAVGRAAIAFYADNFPMLGSIFADRTVLAAHQAGLRARGIGPHQVNEAVMAYLRAEVDAGTLDHRTDVYAAAALFVGACLQHAFLGHMGWAGRRADEDAARSFARQLLAGHAAHPVRADEPGRG